MDSKWISVKDRLPNEGDKVIICERTNMHLVDVLKDGLAVAEDEWYYDITDFYYWMPLPEPPKENYYEMDKRKRQITRTI